jgi:hypothetical protein
MGRRISGWTPSGRHDGPCAAAQEAMIRWIYEHLCLKCNGDI